MLKNIRTYAVIIFLFSFWLSSVSFSAVTNTSATNIADKTNAYYYADPTVNAKKPNFLLTIIKSLFWLSLFAVGLYYLFKYLMKKQNKGNINNDIIKLIAQNSVAMGKYVSVVKILNSYYVLGISDSGITLIKEITEKIDADTLSVLESRLDAAASGRVSFEESLQKLLGQFKPSKSSRNKNFEFMKKQKERLDKLKRKSFDE